MQGTRTATVLSRTFSMQTPSGHKTRNRLIAQA
jgi:hypothetical protein